MSSIFFFMCLVVCEPITNLFYMLQHLYSMPINKYTMCLSILVLFFFSTSDITSGAFCTLSPILIWLLSMHGFFSHCCLRLVSSLSWFPPHFAGVQPPVSP